jgi:hypothetical protein
MGERGVSIATGLGTLYVLVTRRPGPKIGLPLALELASARVNVLSVEDIRGRLNNRFSLLISTQPNGLEHRHRTLRAAIDWSYSLLTVNEQVLLRRLAVFASGFCLDMGEIFCCGEGMGERQILDQISSLVSKSLLVADTIGRAQARYRMLGSPYTSRFLADVLRRTVVKLGGNEDFVGHIGGDDFVMVVPPSRAEIMAQYVVDEFDKGTLLLLDQEDVKRGYLEVRDRQGELKRIPVMSVTIALVKSTDNQIEHFAEVNDIASSLKEYGKRIEGSVVVKERRQDGATNTRPQTRK